MNRNVDYSWKWSKVRIVRSVRCCGGIENCRVELELNAKSHADTRLQAQLNCRRGRQGVGVLEELWFVCWRLGKFRDTLRRPSFARGAVGAGWAPGVGHAFGLCDSWQETDARFQFRRMPFLCCLAS